MNRLESLRFLLNLYNFIKILIYYVNKIFKPLNRLLQKSVTFQKRFK